MFKCFKKNKESNTDSIIQNVQPHFKITLDEYKKKIITLTEAEYRVFSELVQGYSTEEVVKKTKLKINTIRSYQKNIYKKLDVHSKVELIMIYGNMYNYINNIKNDLNNIKGGGKYGI